MAMNNDEIIKELLKDVDFKELMPEQVTGKNGLIQQLTKRVIVSLQSNRNLHKISNSLSLRGMSHYI